MTEPKIRLTLARKKTELKQILALQKANLRERLTEEQAEAQGFLTGVHTYEVLEAMNAVTPSVIVKQGTKVLGYALAMTEPFAAQIPSLAPIHAFQNDTLYRGERLGDLGYLAMGQVCVAESARGRKLPDRMYRYLRTCYQHRFPYLVTSIDVNNLRSRRVHRRAGFEEVREGTLDTGQTWVVVVWDWREGYEEKLR